MSLNNYSLIFSCIIFMFFSTQPLYAQMTLFKLDNDISSWSLVTDGVMGGVSNGTKHRAEIDNKSCIQLSGTVSTDNNGGFIQITHDIDKALAQSAQQYDGIQLEVRGNREQYNIHLRTTDLWFPWQAFRSTFKTDGNWQTVNLPFKSFQAYKTGESLDIKNLKRIGIVAIGRDFDADICLSSIGFYSETSSK